MIAVKDKQGESHNDYQLQITVEDKSRKMIATNYKASDKEVRQKDDDKEITTMEDKHGDNHDDDQLKIITIHVRHRKGFRNRNEFMTVMMSRKNMCVRILYFKILTHGTNACGRGLENLTVTNIQWTSHLQ